MGDVGRLMADITVVHVSQGNHGVRVRCLLGLAIELIEDILGFHQIPHLLLKFACIDKIDGWMDGMDYDDK